MPLEAIDSFNLPWVRAAVAVGGANQDLKMDQLGFPQMVKPIKILGPVLLQDKGSRERYGRRQEAAALLKQLNLGKKSMHYHRLDRIEDMMRKNDQI